MALNVALVAASLVLALVAGVAVTVELVRVRRRARKSRTLQGS